MITSPSSDVATMEPTSAPSAGGSVGTSRSSGKVALFLPDLNGGGAEQVMIKLSRGLRDLGHDVDLVLAMARGPYLNLVPAGVRIVDLKASRTLTSLSPLMAYLRRERPSAMLSALERANVVALWAKRLTRVETRFVVSVHNNISVDSRNSRSIRTRLIPHFVRWTYGGADAIVAVSGGVADDLVGFTGLSRDRVQVIYNPIVSQATFEAAREPLEHPWFLPGEPPVVLAVGRLEPQKDYETLIRAFATARRRRPLRLMILGEGSRRSELESLADDLGVRDDIAMPGFVRNPLAYMSRAAVFALSSRWEGLPTVLVEAMACGASRLVATDCPSGPRELLDDGRYGQLVPVGDPAAFSRAIERSLDGDPVTSEKSMWNEFLNETSAAHYERVLFPE